MPFQARIQKSFGCAGESINGVFVAAGVGIVACQPTIAAAKGGTLSVRGSNTAGSLALGAGHGITTGMIIDIFWTVGGVSGHRAGVSVGTVSGNTVPFSGGGGDNLPILTSVMSCMIQSDGSGNTVNPQPFFCLLAANVQALAYSSPKNAVFRFCTWGTDIADYADISNSALYVPAGVSAEWHQGGPGTLPLNDYNAFLQVTHGELASVTVQAALQTN